MDKKVSINQSSLRVAWEIQKKNMIKTMKYAHRRTRKWLWYRRDANLRATGDAKNKNFIKSIRTKERRSNAIAQTRYGFEGEESALVTSSGQREDKPDKLSVSSRKIITDGCLGV